MNDDNDDPYFSPAPPPSGPSWQPPRRGGFFSLLGRVLLLLIISALVVLPFTPMAGKIKRGLTELAASARAQNIVTREVVRFQKVEPPPPPLPDRFVARKDVDVSTLFNGITINTKLETGEGNYASLEVGDPDSYKVTFNLSLRVPKPNQSVKELARINPDLPAMLPGLEALVTNGKVSSFYHKLYETKTSGIEKDLSRLNKLLDRHNFFDCETILELRDPKTSRRALLIQSEMDVVADGTDGDRASKLDDSIANSDYYQPSTSYFWKKRTNLPNPLLGKWESKLASASDELGKKGIAAERSRQLKATVSQLKAEVEDMKTRSSLIADSDPFIVIPQLFKPYIGINENAPQMGDFVVVIHGRQILPAICGDYGPSNKMGEASLFLARQINAKASPNRRGEDDLKVTYLVFPGTAKKPAGPPNLEEWRTTCMQYLNELGGIGDGFTVHTWEDKFKVPEVVVAPAIVAANPPPAAATPPPPAPAAATTDKSADTVKKPADTVAAPAASPPPAEADEIKPATPAKPASKTGAKKKKS